jgi:hypothetical protein
VDCGVPVPRAAWASGPTDVWVVGHEVVSLDFTPHVAYVARWDGERWDVLADPQRGPLLSVFGFGPDDVWIDGRYHWDGRSFTEHCPPSGASGAIGGAGGRLFSYGPASIAVRDFGQWRRQVALWTSWASIGSGGDGSVWAVTSDGTIASFEGGRWTASPPPQPTPQFVRRAFGTPKGLWVIASGPDPTERLPGSWPETELWYWMGLWWTRSDVPEPEPRAGVAWPSGEAILFGERTWRWTSPFAGWTELPSPLAGRDVLAVHGPSPSSVWVATGASESVPAAVWHWDGASLSQVPAPGAIGSVFETVPGDVWATGHVGCPGPACHAALLHLEGGRFVDVGSPTDPGAVAGSGPDDVWVLDRGGAVRRPDGTPASFVPSGFSSWQLWGEPGVGTFAVRNLFGTIAQRLR